MPAFDLCIFDLDGTLAQTLPAIHESLNAVLLRHDFPTHTLEEVQEMIGQGLRVLIEKALPQNVRPGDPVFETIANEYEKELVRFSHLAKPFPGVKDMLVTLASKGVMLGVCSNKCTSAVERTLDSCFDGWRDMFVTALGVDERHRPKPNPEGVYEIVALATEQRARATGGVAPPFASNEFGIETLRPQESPLRIVYVGDSYIDIGTARAAGLPCIGCRWGYAGARGLDGATATVETARELQDRILGVVPI